MFVGADFFVRRFWHARSVDPGFGREPTAILTFLTASTRFAPDAARVYTRRLLDRFREVARRRGGRRSATCTCTRSPRA